jgi:hypothetical protein
VTKAQELVASIVDNLKASPHGRSDVDRIVAWQVDVLKRVIVAEPSFGWQAENLKYANDVKSLAHKLQRKLEGAPAGTRRTLLAFGAYASLPQMPDPVEIASSDTTERYGGTLLTALHDLQMGCSTILDPKNKNKIGDYHTLDRTKHFCAATGFELMVGLEAGQPTNGDPFRSITNSLYEIVVPDAKSDLDLRTQCEKVLSNWRKDPAYLKRHIEALKQAFAGMIAQKSTSSM